MDKDSSGIKPEPSIPGLLDLVSVERPIPRFNMALFPLRFLPGRNIDNPDENDAKTPITLREALLSKQAEALETGRIPRVRIRNLGDRPLMILDGDTVLGGAQNRMINFPVLIPGGQSRELPAACVEIKRWDLAGKTLDRDPVPDQVRRFGDCGLAPGKLRRAACLQTFDQTERGLEPQVDQNLTWTHIAQYFAALGLKSKTFDVHELYNVLENKLEMELRHFMPRRGQIGAIIALNRTQWNLDLFAHPDMYRALHERIVKSWLLDAIITFNPDLARQWSPPPTLAQAKTFLKEMKVGRQRRYRLPTGGECLYFRSRKTIGNAAADSDSIFHIFACDQSAP